MTTDYFTLFAEISREHAARDADFREQTYRRGMLGWVERAERDRRQIEAWVTQDRRQAERRKE